MSDVIIIKRPRKVAAPTKKADKPVKVASTKPKAAKSKKA